MATIYVEKDGWATKRGRNIVGGEEARKERGLWLSMLFFNVVPAEIALSILTLLIG